MVDDLTHMMAVGTGWVAILMPVLLIWVIFYFATKMDKAKYESMVEIAKNLEDPSDVEDLLENFKEKKKPIDYRRNGVIVLFVGLGLVLFGTMSDIDVLQGVGLLVATIGIGLFIAGYIYPNAGSEIDKAVEKFEEK